MASARPSNRTLVDHLRSTGTGKDKLVALQTALGQGNQRVPLDVLDRARRAGLPELTIRKIDRYLNPDDSVEPAPTVDSDGYTVPSDLAPAATAEVIPPSHGPVEPQQPADEYDEETPAE